MWLLKLLISRESREICESLKKMLLSSLQTLVLEQDFELRFVICGLFLTFLQTNTYKTASETSFLLSFLLKQVAIHDEEIKEKVNIFEFYPGTVLRLP